jgi:plasmid segregation protein ParM
MVADIGNGTINVMYMNDKSPVSSRCYTEKMGVEQCVIAAQNDVIDKYGVLIDRTVIETFLRTGNANVTSKYFMSLQDSAIRYADKIMAVLNKYEYNPELMKLYVCGGGVSIIKHFYEIEDQNVVYIDDICAGAKGYEHIAVKLAKRVSA